MGFINQDVNIQAAKLYTDAFILYNIQNMGTIGLIAIDSIN
ncbi:hypothetical protein EM808_25000 [Niallia taxi]|uniref:Uncharacterized protein n=1 Tax=Niallia taxi TaxID=2499688 RepID=A0A3S2UTS4_9BACI|nr:hypothetical protein EM808_25000 [Niallia taxi]